MQGGGQQQYIIGGPASGQQFYGDQQFMNSSVNRGDNSFDNEVNPIQEQLQNKFASDGRMNMNEQQYIQQQQYIL